MHTYVFNSLTDHDVLGFTHNATGSNLPLEYAPWQLATEGWAVLVGGDVGPVAEAIRRDGFFVAIEEEAVRSAEKGH
jgi:hypothetical protein